MQRIKVGSLVVDYYPALSVHYDYPLLLIHGAHGNSECFENYGQFFSERGWRVYAINLRGHAPSDYCTRLGMATIDDYVADVLAVINTLALSDAVLIGHSMGGLLAQKAAEKLPYLKAIIGLASSPPQGIQWIFSYVPQKLKILMALCKVLDVILMGQPLYLDYHLAKAILLNNLPPEMIEQVFKQLVPESWVATGQLVTGVTVNRDRISCPKLFLAFGQDKLLAAGLQQEIADFYRSDCICINQLAHLGILESDWKIGAEIIAGWLVGKIS